MPTLRLALAFCLLAGLLTTPIVDAATGATSELVVLNWADYIAPDLIVKFEKLHHVKVRVVYFDDDNQRDQLLLANNGAGYDLALINETNLEFYRQRDWLAPLTEAEAPNLKHIDPKWAQAYSASGYATPYFWGTLGIAYRRDLLKTAPRSWLDLMRPSAALRGRIAMLTSQREVLGMALKALGHSLNSTENEDLSDATKLLLEQKPFVRSYETAILTDESELVTGVITMRMMYSGDALMLKSKNDNIDYIVPDEGTAIWVDYLAVMSASRHPALAYQFIDFLNEPVNAARNAAFVNYATPNKVADALMPAEYHDNGTIYPNPRTLAKSERFLALPPRAVNRRNSEFAQLLH